MALTKIGKEGITGISNSSDANAITISSGEQVTIAGATTLVGSVTHGTDSGDTRFSVNSANQYTMVFKNAGNIAGQIGGGGSDILRFSNAAGATTMEMNAGQQTLPLQPAFQIKSGASQDNISINANTTVVMANEHFDVGSNVASNTFTAPVTGKYQLNLQLRLNNVDSAAAFYQARINTSNKIFYTTIDPDFGQDAAYWTFILSIFTDMDASDTATVGIFQSLGTSQTDVSNDSHFSGYLVC